MPIHDWTRVEAGIFHHFHQVWITEIARTLNRGLLPPDYYALAEQTVGRLGPDVLTLQRSSSAPLAPRPATGGIALAETPPQVRVRVRGEASRYANRASTVAVRHTSNHQVIALVEVVSPGNKNNRHGIQAFVRKAQEALLAGVHLLILDLFPPGPRDPGGIHPLIWEGQEGEEYAPPPEKPLTLAAYAADNLSPEAFVEPVAVGDTLPEMPVFLTPEVYVPLSLDPTYQNAWEDVPAFWRDVVTGISPA